MNAYELTLHEMLAHGFISYRDLHDMAAHYQDLRPRPVPLTVVYRDE